MWLSDHSVTLDGLHSIGIFKFTELTVKSDTWKLFEWPQVFLKVQLKSNILESFRILKIICDA